MVSAVEDSLFFDSIIPMDLNSVGSSSSSLFDQVVLPETTELDASAVDFWDDNDDDIFSLNPSLNVAPSEDSFQLADCSSENLSAPRISRVRRGAEPSFCNNGPSPAAGGGQPGSADEGMIDLQSLLRSPDIEEALKVHFGTTEKRNAFCYWYSAGKLPWGVCSSGDNRDITPSTSVMEDYWSIWENEKTVSHGWLGKSVQSQ